jgi:hypothetical protein
MVVTTGFEPVTYTMSTWCSTTELSDYGDLGMTRTCDPRFRKPMLYPAELRDLIEEFHCFFERSYLIVQIYTSVRKEYIDILTIFVNSVLIAHP